MSTLAAEVRFGSLSTYVFPTDAYDKTKLGLGTLMDQNSGGSAEQNYVGPLSVGLARPIESIGAVPGFMPWVLSWSPSIDWVFLADNAVAAATRRVQLFEFNRTTSVFTWKGYVTCAFPFAGTQNTYLVKAFRMTYDKYVTGTAAASGTGVTGTSTLWTDSRLAVGSRIGFGSTDPAAIGTWYEIGTIGSNTSITLTGSAGTIVDGPYVIEELRVIHVLTNASTTTNGGLFVTKGLRYENFSSGGTSVVAATTVDNQRLTYWLGDASTSVNITGFGCGLQARDSWTQHYCWVIDVVANPILYKYNLRAALTPTAGKDYQATTIILKTGSGGAVTGTASVVNNGRIATVNHGTGASHPCFYFTTTIRFYRTVDVTTIAATSTTFLSGGDVLPEYPPGTSTTFPLTAKLNNVEYSSYIDRFILLSDCSAGLRSYVTQYVNPFERIFLIDAKFTPQLSIDGTLGVFPNTLSLVSTVWAEGGMCYLCTHGTTATTNLLYAFPVGADWEYAAIANQRIITPEILTPNCSAFLRAYVNEVDIVGGSSGKGASVTNLGSSTEPYRVWYRTANIDVDATSSWTLLDSYRDLSSVSGASSVQFMFEFKTIGLTCLPARIMSIAVLYNDTSTDSHFQPSVGKSNLSTTKFAWRLSTAFGTAVPKLRIRLYNAVTGDLLSDDNTTSPVGTFEKSTNDGTGWGTWATGTADKTNDVTYLRYTPASIGSGIRVRALLSL